MKTPRDDVFERALSRFLIIEKKRRSNAQKYAKQRLEIEKAEEKRRRQTINQLLDQANANLMRLLSVSPLFLKYLSLVMAEGAVYFDESNLFLELPSPIDVEEIRETEEEVRKSRNPNQNLIVESILNAGFEIKTLPCRICWLWFNQNQNGVALVLAVPTDYQHLGKPNFQKARLVLVCYQNAYRTGGYKYSQVVSFSQIVGFDQLVVVLNKLKSQRPEVTMGYLFETLDLPDEMMPADYFKST